MNIEEIKQLVKAIASGDKKVPVMITGDQGIGKSQGIQQVAEELGYQYIDLRLAEQEPGDLIGLPRVVDEVTKWSRPDWIPAKDVPTMLVLEELNRAPTDVQQAIFQVLTEYKIHTHLMPTNTMIVVCVNPSDSIYHVSELDPALLSRGIQIKAEFDSEIFLQYAYKKAFDERIIQFLNVHKELGNKPIAKETCPNPRAWENLNKIIARIPKNLDAEVIGGLVGKETAVAFIRFCDERYAKPLSAKDIFTNYDKKEIKDKLAKQTNDATWRTVEDINTQIAAGVSIKDKAVKNLGDFLQDIGDEWKVSILKKLPQKLVSKLTVTSPDLITKIATIAEDVAK